MLNIDEILDAVYDGAIEACGAVGHRMAQDTSDGVRAALGRRSLRSFIERSSRVWQATRDAEAVLAGSCGPNTPIGAVLVLLRSAYATRTTAIRDVAAAGNQFEREVLLAQTVETALAALGAAFLTELLKEPAPPV